MQGYLIINTIVGGQTLAEVSPHLDATLGIVIIALVSLVVRAPPTLPPTSLCPSSRFHPDYLLRMQSPALVRLTSFAPLDHDMHGSRS